MVEQSIEDRGRSDGDGDGNGQDANGAASTAIRTALNAGHTTENRPAKQGSEPEVIPGDADR